MARRLLFLNGLATLCLILVHSSSWGFIGMFWWTDRYLPVTVPNFDQMRSLSYYSLRVVEQLTEFGVPAFLFVSGFFIAFAVGRSQASEGWRVAGSRIKILIIPYVLWSIVALFGDYLQGRTYSMIEYLRMLVVGGAADPYYYIPLLTQLLLLSPIIIIIARKNWRMLLFVSALLLLSIRSLRYLYYVGLESPVLEQLIKLTPIWFFPGKLFWFAFGVVVSLHLHEIKPWITRYKWILFVVLVVLFPLGILEWEILLHVSNRDWLAYSTTIVDSLFAFVFILCFLAFENVTYPFSKKLLDLGGKSYGVYLVHALVLVVVAKIIYHLAPFALAYQAVFQPVLIAFGLGIPLMLMATVKRSPARRFYRYLFG